MQGVVLMLRLVTPLSILFVSVVVVLSILGNQLVLDSLHSSLVFKILVMWALLEV
jgi:hypothetical protein